MRKSETPSGYMICAIFASKLLELTEILAHTFAPRLSSLFDLKQKLTLQLLYIREISHLRHVFAGGCVQPKGLFLPVHQLGNPAETAGSFKRSFMPLSLAQQNTPLNEDKRWCFESFKKMALLEVEDMLTQDHKTVLVQKSTSQVSWIYLEFGEIGSLAARLRQIACSCAIITFQVCWNRSFPARPSKISIEWCGWALRCIVFGVVVELGTPRISDPTAFVACHSDTICQTHLATFESAVYGSLAQHFTPSCANALASWRCGSTTIAGIQQSLREVSVAINVCIRNGFCSWMRSVW